MELKKNKQDIVVFVVIFIFTLITTYSFLLPHYSIDTLEFVNNGYKNYSDYKFFQDGRVFSGILLNSLENVNLKLSIVTLYIIGILISCYSVIYLSKIIKNIKQPKNILQEIVVICISYITIFNFMYLDTFEYFEFPIIALSILLYIISANILINNGKNKILISAICVILGMFCYQGTINVFISFVSLFMIVKNKKINKDFFVCCAISLIAIFINYLYIKIKGGNDALRGSFNIFSNILNTINNIIILIFETSKMYPKFLQISFVIFILALIFIKTKSKKDLKNIAIILCFSYVLSFIMIALENYNDYNYYGRIFFPVGAILGYIFVYIYCNTNALDNKKKFFIPILGIVFIVEIIVNFTYIYSYFQGQKIYEKYVKQVVSYIEEYENQSGEKIEYFGYKGQGPLGIVLKSGEWENLSDIAKNYFRAGTSFKTSDFKVFCNRNFEKVYLDDEIYDEYFENKSLNEITRENFVFIGNTVYFVI